MREFQLTKNIKGIDFVYEVQIDDENHNVRFFISANNRDFAFSWILDADSSFPWDDFNIFQQIVKGLANEYLLSSIEQYISTYNNPNYLETEMAKQGFTLISPEKQ